MQSILLRKPLSGDVLAANDLERLEVTANVNDENLVIIFRKNISGITQRLGEISLRKDENQEIDSISWAATAVTRSTDLDTEVKDLKAKYEEQGRTIDKLNQQLENLIQAKLEHENSLLSKFRELLNAKKSKIRDLHRALARVKVDPQSGKLSCFNFRPQALNHPLTAAQLQITQEPPSPRSPAASRSTKRKARGTRPTTTASVSSSDDEEEEGFEKMSVDGEHEKAQASTPERYDPSVTEDEDDSDDDLDSAPIFSQPVEKGSVPNSPDETSAYLPARRPTPPPRRELPFKAPPRQPAVKEESMAKKTEPASRSQATNNTSAMPDGDDDEETSDDEL